MQILKLKGFTLIEIAFVIAIIGIIAYGSLTAYSQHRYQIKRTENKLLLHEAEIALWGYLGNNHHLPCPDSDYPPDGKENRISFRCSQNQGTLPYLDLGTATKDVWGNPFYYAISPSATNSIAITKCNAGDYAVNCDINNTQGYTASYFSNLKERKFDLFTNVAEGSNQPADTTADLTVKATTNFSSELVEVAKDIPLIIISFGQNGKRNWQQDGFNCPANLSANEKENCDKDSNFVHLPPIDIGSINSEKYFDDQMLWISPYIIKAKAIEMNVIML